MTLSVVSVAVISFSKGSIAYPLTWRIAAFFVNIPAYSGELYDPFPPLRSGALGAMVDSS
jgi:hypothetical protein